MDLVLYYRGLLPSNGTAKEKHAIREKFHHQLKRLWTLPPFNYKYKGAVDRNERILPPGLTYESFGGYYKECQFPFLLKKVNSFNFLPLVCTELHAVAEINVTILRPEPSGRVVTEGGDLDNRVKTLLDALQVPDDNQSKKLVVKEDPFCCLLENDKLITKLSVKAEHLLEPLNSPKEVVLLLNVTTRRTEATLHNDLIA
jgi:hypothetical protein